MDGVYKVPEVSGNLYEPMVLEGLVKWFDFTRGFGFVVVPGQPDIILHLSVLKRDECAVPVAGAAISLTCELRPKGLQCTKVHSIDNSTVLLKPIKATPKRGVDVDLSTLSKWRRVRVKWFNSASGYGFVTTLSGTEDSDIFIHKEVFRQLPHFTFKMRINEDDEFEVRYAKSNGRFHATHVRAVQ